MGEYPRFKRGEVQKGYAKFSVSDKKIIEDYVKYISITSNSKNRLENNRRSLSEFRMLVNKPLDKIELEDLRKFLVLVNNSPKTQATRNDLKHTLKRFLRWKYKDWSERFDNLSDIKLIVGMNEEKINAEMLLTKEDVEKIMKAEESLFWQTFFITLYESGLRPIELRNLRWKNIKFNIQGDISEINIFATKTSRARSVYVKEATKYLETWKKRQQKLEMNTELVFPSKRNKDIPITKEGPSIWLGRISKRVLGRSVYPYVLRHSRATELYTNTEIPDKMVRKFLGHSKSMSDVYTHLSNKDVKETMSKVIYNLGGPEEMPEEKKHILEIKVEQLQKDNKEQDVKINKMLSDLSFIKKTFGEVFPDIEKKFMKK